MEPSAWSNTRPREHETFRSCPEWLSCIQQLEFLWRFQSLGFVDVEPIRELLHFSAVLLLMGKPIRACLRVLPIPIRLSRRLGRCQSALHQQLARQWDVRRRVPTGRYGRAKWRAAHWTV